VLAAVVIALAAHHSAQTRRPPRIVTTLTDVVNAMQFSPDGRTLAIARGSREDNRVELWDVTSGNLRRTIRGFDGMIWSVSFSPDGHTLVTGSGGIHQEKVAQKPTSRNGRPFTELKWWDSQTGELKQRLELPDEDLMSIAAVHSPNGRLLATVENRLSTAMVFDSPRSIGPVASDPIVRSFPLRAAGFDSELKLLDANNGEVRLKLKGGFTNSYFPVFSGISRGDFLSLFGGNFRVIPIAFSPDGQFVAAWNGSEIRLWSSSTGAEILKIKKFKGRLSAVAFSPDGHLLAGAIVKFSFKDNRPDFKSEIRIWEVATGAPRQVFALSTPSVSSLVFASNGQQLLVGGLQTENNHSYASMELADLQTGSLGKLIAKDEGGGGSICLSPDGEIMAFQTDASTVKLVETRDWRTKYTLGADDDASSRSASLRRFLVSVKSVPAVAFLPDGKTVAGAIEEGGIKLWDTRTGEVKKTLAQEAETGAVAEISASGGMVAEVTGDESVQLWNVESGTHNSIPTASRNVLAIGLSGNGKILAIAYANQIVLMDPVTLKPEGKVEGIQGEIVSVALSFDGKILATATTGGAVKIWDAGAGTLKQSLAAGAEVSALRFAPQDQFLAIGTRDGRVNIWSLQNGGTNFELKKHSAAVNAIAFSQDGTLMATGGDDRTAIIWEVSSRKSRRTLKGHDLAITSLAFSPDGGMLAVGSGNASVVLWEVASGKLDRVLK
jgi:WD40 repeat protein